MLLQMSAAMSVSARFVSSCFCREAHFTTTNNEGKIVFNIHLRLPVFTPVDGSVSTWKLFLARAQGSQASQAFQSAAAASAAEAAAAASVRKGRQQSEET